MSVVVTLLLLMTINAAGQGAETTADERTRRTVASGNGTQSAADERTAGSTAERPLLGSGHLGTADCSEGQSAGHKNDNGNVFHTITP